MADVVEVVFCLYIMYFYLYNLVLCIFTCTVRISICPGYFGVECDWYFSLWIWIDQVYWDMLSLQHTTRDLSSLSLGKWRNDTKHKTRAACLKKKSWKVIGKVKVKVSVLFSHYHPDISFSQNIMQFCALDFDQEHSDYEIQFCWRVNVANNLIIQTSCNLHNIKIFPYCIFLLI